MVSETREICQVDHWRIFKYALLSRSRYPNLLIIGDSSLAGVGKSFLAFYPPKVHKLIYKIRSLVIDHLGDRLKAEEAGVAYIYFDYKSQETQTATNIAVCLLKQLSHQLNDLDEALEETYDRLERSNRTPELPTLIDLLVSTVKSFNPCFIILDALDECGGTQIKQIISMIYQLRVHIRLFATNQAHQKAVQDLFESAPTITIQAHKSDLENFVQANLRENDISGVELQDITTRIMENAKGL
jgi:hypothetical protein